MIFSGLIEAEDGVYPDHFPGVLGGVRKIDNKKEECVVVFFGDERRKVTVSFFAVKKIIKKSGVVITRATADTRCFACGGRAILSFSLGSEEICCCNNEECRDYVFEKIKSRQQNALRRDRKLLR